MKIVTGFRDFILRGNVIDLAVAVVIGTAFTAVVTSVVDNLVTPLIAAIGSAPNLDEAFRPTLNGAAFGVGAILGAVINFLVIAAVVYFLIVTPMNRLLTLRKKGAVDEPKAPSEEVLLLTEIRDLLAREGHATTRTQGDAT